MQQPQPAVLLASSQIRSHDLIFHTIFGCDTHATLEFVRASAVRLHSITQCTFLERMMQSLSPGKQTPLPDDAVKALFFLFLNVDMVLKEYVCDTANVKAFASAMNIRLTGSAGAPAELQYLERMHAWSMLGTLPMNHKKAARFFTVLHDRIVRAWLQDERLCATDLVQMVKDEYLIC